MDITKAVALVTGANRGLGHAIVAGLLESGAPKVYAASRSVGNLESTLALDQDRVIPVQLDITNRVHRAALADAVSDCTLLVNNAGVLDYRGPTELDEHTIDRNMDTNFKGPLATTNTLAPVITGNGGGAVVNVLTFLCFVSAPIFAAYNASKAASWSAAMALRPYLLEQGIATINVFPTTIDTEMVAELEKTKDPPADVAAAIVDGIRTNAEDVYPCAAAAAFEAWRADPKAVEANFALIR